MGEFIACVALWLFGLMALAGFVDLEKLNKRSKDGEN